MTDKQIKLLFSVAFLDAIRISPRRWVYKDDCTRRWYIVSEKQMLALADHCADPLLVDAYSIWCANNIAKEMPQGWQPPGNPYR